MSDTRIEQAIEKINAKLLILDPLQCFCGGRDLHSVNGMRPLLKRIGDIAERTGCAIVLISHLNKGRGQTRAIYSEYMSIKNARNQNEFYENHRAEITLHQAAKKYFYERGLKKLPSINKLRNEWAELEKERSPLYAEYKKSNQKFKELCNAKSNANKILGIEKSHVVER